jgi:O-antigen/teichoic acid export membrane protein
VREYGTYSYVLGLLNVVSLVASLDLGGAALRFVGFYTSAGDWSLLRGFLRTSRRLVAALSMGVAVLGAAAVLLLRARLEPGLAAALLAACVLLVPASLISLELNLLQALRRVFEVRVPNMFVRPLAFALVLLLATRVFGAERTAATAVLANAAGTVTALALSLYLFRRVWPAAARTAPAATRTREWLSFSAMSLGSSVLYMVLSQQSDVIIVGSVIGTTQAGLYSAAGQIGSLILFGVITVNHFASPMMAEYQNRPGDPGLRALVRRITLLNCALSVPLITALLLAGPLLLRSFGPEFVAAYPVLVVLVVGHTINAAWGALWGTLLTMTGFQKEASALVVVVAALNMALTLVLTPRYGIVGAASATTIAVAVRGVLILLLVRRRLGFWPWSRGAAALPAAA